MTAGRLHLRRDTAATLTLLTLAAVVAGCAAGTPTGAPTQPGASTQPGSPAPSTAATPPAASSAPAVPGWTALADSAPYKALAPEQQQKISALEAMDRATFEKQSRDDQLAYGAFLREVYQDDAIAGAPGTSPGVPVPAAGNVSLTSTGEEIIHDERLKEATARQSVQPDRDAATTRAAPGSNYTKMAPSRVSPLFPTAYAEASAPAGMTQESVLAVLSDPKRMLILDQSNNFIPYDGSWEPLEFRVIEMQRTESQARSQFYFAYTPFLDIHGAENGVWILMFNAQESQERWIPDLAVID
ncbi:hypothetical protein [Arthrobacter sp. U41]|uniref:hypothetical protein n=1 Tax=Arthrobacter sp. U41 TaxID=1849032 RepID=UPI0008593DE7|nr:hypothetical protein [Arthrobacter sp. U41]AOT03498.1 hypothetical protein ASPU41_09295 [Arthrobacter sp. U41]